MYFLLCFSAFFGFYKVVLWVAHTNDTHLVSDMWFLIFVSLFFVYQHGVDGRYCSVCFSDVDVCQHFDVSVWWSVDVSQSSVFVSLDIFGCGSSGLAYGNILWSMVYSHWLWVSHLYLPFYLLSQCDSSINNLHTDIIYLTFFVQITIFFHRCI